MKYFSKAAPERALGAAALLIIALISLGNVITRYITGGSFSFTEELSVFLLVLMSLAGASVALRNDRHIRISLLERALPSTWRRPLILIQGLCVLAVLLLISYYGGKMAWEEYQWGSESPGLGLPQWWYLIWLPILSATMTLRQLQRLWERLTNSSHPSDPQPSGDQDDA